MTSPDLSRRVARALFVMLDVPMSTRRSLIEAVNGVAEFSDLSAKHQALVVKYERVGDRASSKTRRRVLPRPTGKV